MKIFGMAHVVAIVAFSQAAFAAPQSQTLRGTVVDASNRPVAQAEVTILRDQTVVAQVKTDRDGSFTFEASPRAYRADIVADGFAPLHSSPIPFRTGGVTRFTVRAPGALDLSQSPVHALRNTTPWEAGLFAEGGVGTEDRSDYKFFQVGGHVGKVLTPQLGTGLLSGNFEYSVEVIPYWSAHTPRFQRVFCNADPGAVAGSYTCSQPYTVGGTFNGVSVTPIQLRWNLTHGQRWMPWLQGAGGVVWTNHKFPPIGNTNVTDLASNGIHGDTSVWNFTPQFGVGTHYFLRSGRSLDFSANAVHLSSASLGDKNPGVNASVLFTVGYTWWK